MSFRNIFRVFTLGALFCSTTAFAAKNWPSSGKAVIPAGENWSIENATDVANVAGLDEIEFADATAGATYTASTDLALKAKLSGKGSFAAVGGSKVTFSGDSHGFEGVIAITNTVTYMASRYGLGSTKSRVILHQDTAGDRFFVSATGADCMIDAPITFSGGIKFGPVNAADTLVISNDLKEVVGGSDATTAFYVKGNVHVKAGTFGTKKNHMYPSVAANKTLTIDGDTAISIDGGLYCMFTSPAYLEFGATNIVKLSALNVYTGSSEGFCKFTVANVCRSKVFALQSTAGSPVRGSIDLNGLDQTFSNLAGVNWTSAGAPLNAYVIQSAKPATLTLSSASVVSADSPAEINGAVALHVKGMTTQKLRKPSDSTGELRVGENATVTLVDTAAWGGTNVVVEGNGKLDCQSPLSINKRITEVLVRENGVLNVASGVELQLCGLTVNGREVPYDKAPYTVSQIQKICETTTAITGEGTVLVAEKLEPWSGWPTGPVQKVTIPSKTEVVVDTAEDLKRAMWCSEIVLQGGASVDFRHLTGTDSLLVTNKFSGYGTVKFSNIPNVYMDSDASELVRSGHVAFDLCDTVIVSNAVAVGGLLSGACQFNSDQNKRRRLLFAGEGDIYNQAPVQMSKSFLFGTLSDSARLYQTNSWLVLDPEASQWSYAYITNKVTFCAGTNGTVAGGTAFFCGYKTTDIVLTDNTVFKSTGATFPYDKGVWHWGSKTNQLGGLHPGLTDMTIICDRTNVFNSVAYFQPYNTSGSPTGCLDLNGFDQSAPYFTVQNAGKSPSTPTGWDETSEWRVYIRSAKPAMLTATSTAGATRNRINYWFEGQAGFWLKGNDNVTISRTQSTSTGDLRISGGSLTLDWASSWAGNVIIDGGKLIVDATAGGKYLDQAKYADVPVFARNAKISISNGGKLKLDRDVAAYSVSVGGYVPPYLPPGEWGSTASGAAKVRDDLFEGNGKITVKHVPHELGFLIITR